MEKIHSIKFAEKRAISAALVAITPDLNLRRGAGGLRTPLWGVRLITLHAL